MKKDKIQSFIDRYTLGGLIQTVKWSQGDTLKTRFISPEKTLIGEVECTDQLVEYTDKSGKKKNIPEDSLVMYDTDTLRKFLSIVGDDITISLLENESHKPYKIRIKDERSDVDYLLSDKSIVPPVPPDKSIPDFDMTIHLTPDFVSRFLKATSAMQDVEGFTIKWESDTYNIFLSHGNENGSRVRIEVEYAGEENISGLKFSTKYLREILNANKGFKKGNLHISQKGLAKVEFEIDGFNVLYYMIKLDV